MGSEFAGEYVQCGWFAGGWAGKQVAVVLVSSQVSGGFVVGQPELNRIITTVEEILITAQAGQPIVESEQKFEVQPGEWG